MLKMFKNKTSSFHSAAFDNIEKLNDIRMIQTLIDVIFSLDFIGFDG